MVDAQTLWQKTLDIIRPKIGQTGIDTWFGPVKAKDITLQVLTLEVPDNFFKEWLIDHYLSLMQEALNSVADQPLKIEFSINPELISKGEQGRLNQFKSRIEATQKEPLSLNPRYTFDNFVVGAANRFAHAASLAVAEQPAKAYNPLFIYGRVGLGKTHLIQAICHAVLAKNPQAKIHYTASERFTNELIDAIQHRTTPKFRLRYREQDLLLIDDIHFIAGKESTQEEFFHTFNTLYDNHKQIIITSDRMPKEIPGLEERLVSRFSWGLITDIQPPDLETRIAILKKKIEREPVKVGDDVIYFIAESIKTNIRELEGALIRVVAYSLLEERPITLELAQDILQDMLRESRRIIGIDVVQKRVADFFNLTLQDLKTTKRNRNIVLARQIAMYLARELTNLSFPEIGECFGGKDHTTVLHAYNKIRISLNKDGDLKNTIHKIILEIKH